MLSSRVISRILFFVLGFSIPAWAADIPMENFLPSSCPEDWVLDGKVTLYDRDTLFDRINGEAELYMPYGFDILISSRYASKQDPNIAIEADVYKMGSPLDAFGIFANYRRKTDRVIKMGAEGTISASQLFFYQDRFFVRLQATGATSVDENVLRTCSQTIAQKISGTAKKPDELEIFNIPSLVPGSERYISQSVLGYDFFRRGLIADVFWDKQTVQVFIVLEDSEDAARKTFGQYQSYLKTSGRILSRAGNALAAVDPLYSNVLIEQTGRYLIGAIRFKDAGSINPLILEIKKRLVN